jgi:hypothetical protein
MTMTGHAPRGSVDLVRNNLHGLPAANFQAARQNMGAKANVNMGGQQLRIINMATQVPAGIPKVEVQHPRNVSFHGLPPTITVSEASSDDGYFKPPARHRAACAPISQTFLILEHTGHDPSISHPTAPTSTSMPLSQIPEYNLVAPQSIDASLRRRPYQYSADAHFGQYPTMMNDVQLLQDFFTHSPKPANMRQFVDILARRSPDELDALKASFSLVATNTDLTVLFQQLLREENDSCHYIRWSYFGSYHVRLVAFESKGTYHFFVNKV